MRAVVMAGGEGTRLRPLTSNQPKPMVPIVGKPCMEHILELLRKHGVEEVVVTVAFLPQAIRSYFGDGSALGLDIQYSVEEVLAHVPKQGPFDFSKELFPLLLEMGRPMYGCVCDGYWQDIGNLDQFRQANFDALDEKVDLGIPGLRLRGNVWIGEGVEIDDL